MVVAGPNTVETQTNACHILRVHHIEAWFGRQPGLWQLQGGCHRHVQGRCSQEQAGVLSTPEWLECILECFACWTRKLLGSRTLCIHQLLEDLAEEGSRSSVGSRSTGTVRKEGRRGTCRVSGLQAHQAVLLEFRVRFHREICRLVKVHRNQQVDRLCQHQKLEMDQGLPHNMTDHRKDSCTGTFPLRWASLPDVLHRLET